jgi:hypothetical protein
MGGNDDFKRLAKEMAEKARAQREKAEKAAQARQRSEGEAHREGSGEQQASQPTQQDDAREKSDKK